MLLYSLVVVPARVPVLVVAVVGQSESDSDESSDERAHVYLFNRLGYKHNEGRRGRVDRTIYSYSPVALKLKMC